MKKEYDFSKGEKGKFFSKTAKFNIPVYLDPELERFFMKIAQEKNDDFSSVVNNILIKDKELMEMAQ